MKKSFLFLILAAILSACGGTDISDVKGEYLLISSRCLYYNGKEIQKIVWFKDSVAIYNDGEFAYGHSMDSLVQRRMYIEESGRHGYVRNTLLGEPDANWTQEASWGLLSYAPERRIISTTNAIDPNPGSPSYYVFLLNGMIVIRYEGHSFFYSKPIKVVSNNASQLDLEKAKPFFVDITNADGVIVGKAEAQYTYGPIYKHGDKIEWDAECIISDCESVGTKIDAIKFHIEGTRVK